MIQNKTVARANLRKPSETGDTSDTVIRANIGVSEDAKVVIPRSRCGLPNTLFHRNWELFVSCINTRIEPGIYSAVVCSGLDFWAAALGILLASKCLNFNFLASLFFLCFLFAALIFLFIFYAIVISSARYTSWIAFRSLIPSLIFF